MTRDISQLGEGHQKHPHAISLVAPPSPHSTASPKRTPDCKTLPFHLATWETNGWPRMNADGLHRKSRGSSGKSNIGSGHASTAGNSPPQKRTIVSSCRRETLTGCDHTARQYRRGHVTVVIPERIQLKQRPSPQGVRLSSRSRDCVAISGSKVAAAQV